MERVKQFAIVASGLILAIGAILAALPGGRAPIVWHERSHWLLHVLPTRVIGWSSRPLPIGETEYADAKARDLLRFDDFFYYEFSRGADHVTVYVAYWRPGSAVTEEIAGHTPDVCWVCKGWTVVASDDSRQISAASKTLFDGRWRRMEYNGTMEDVVYWHLADGKLYVSSTDPVPLAARLRYWRGRIIAVVAGKNENTDSCAEQFFVRLASNVPFEELAGDRGFQEVVRALARLGLGGRKTVQ